MSSISPTANPVVPRDLVFNGDTLLSVIAYAVMFFVAAFGNLTVFITLFRNRHRKSRVNLFIMHLSIADMIVTFVMIPMEISWHVTVSWKAGDVACRILMFCRPFGFYLSSFILVAISIDRYFAITHPLSLNDADQRGKLMLCLAWLFSIVASVPQSVIYHVEHHPVYSWFTQCVTFNFYPTAAHELTYNLFNMAAIYAVPLLIIVISYTMVMWEISKKSRESKKQISVTPSSRRLRGTDIVRRSGIGNLEKARIRTLKMTIAIVLVFVTCWTPYFVINAWFWFDKDYAQQINPKVTRGLLVFAVSNSCVNPIVYGMFTQTFSLEFKSRFWPNSRSRSQHLVNSLSPSNRRHLIVRRMTINDQRLPVNTPNTLSQQGKHACALVGQSWISGSGEAVDVSSTPSSSQSSAKISVKRMTTPPHIAQGMGRRNSYTSVNWSACCGAAEEYR